MQLAATQYSKTKYPMWYAQSAVTNYSTTSASFHDMNNLIIYLDTTFKALPP